MIFFKQCFFFKQWFISLLALLLFTFQYRCCFFSSASNRCYISPCSVWPFCKRPRLSLLLIWYACVDNTENTRGFILARPYQDVVQGDIWWLLNSCNFSTLYHAGISLSFNSGLLFPYVATCVLYTNCVKIIIFQQACSLEGHCYSDVSN